MLPSENGELNSFLSIEPIYNPRIDQNGQNNGWDQNGNKNVQIFPMGLEERYEKRHLVFVVLKGFSIILGQK